jgi:uncharacterized phiE125 gp8 family phage protein
MSLKLITPPTALAVDLDQAKLELRVQSGSIEDPLVTRLIEAATDRAEHLTGRAIMQQDWELVLDAFPAEIRLAKPTVSSILWIKYLDADGVEQTLSNSLYALDADLLPGWVLPAAGTSWPATQAVANAVRVRFRCGYGNTAAAVPKGLVDWLMVQVATRYDNRDLVALGKADASWDSYGARLLDPFMTYT